MYLKTSVCIEKIGLSETQDLELSHCSTSSLLLGLTRYFSSTEILLFCKLQIRKLLLVIRMIINSDHCNKVTIFILPHEYFWNNHTEKSMIKTFSNLVGTCLSTRKPGYSLTASFLFSKLRLLLLFCATSKTTQCRTPLNQEKKMQAQN